MTFFLYKLAGSFATPPGLIVALLLLCALMAFRRPRKPLLGSSLLLLATLLYLLSAPASSRRLLAPLEDVESTLPEAGHRAAIVVLAAGVWEGADGERELKPHTLQRLVGAWELARNRSWPIILSGGSLRGGDETLADAMARRLTLWGFKGPLVLEGRSRTTWENLARSAPLLEAEAITDVVVVTHAYHMRRALLSAGKALPGLTLHAWPVGHLADGRTPTALDWLPDAGNLFQSCLALREWLGLMAYRLYL